MNYVPARQAARSLPLSGVAVYKVMRGLFPKRNDYGLASFDELVPELDRFGVRTVGAFERLMKRHRRELLAIDRSPIDEWHTRYYSREFGEAEVKDKLRRQFWFAYPALVRIAAELEWGEAAEVREDAE